MAKAKKSKSKKAKTKKTRKTAKRAAASRGPARKSKAKKSKAGKAKKAARKSAKPEATTARKAAPQNKKPNKKQIVGEGDYRASRSFLKDQADFVKRHANEIPAMGREAEASLDGPQGGELRAAEDEARGHSRASGE